MAKKTSKKGTKSLKAKSVKTVNPKDQAVATIPPAPTGANTPNIPPEMQQKLSKLQEKLTKFKDQVLDKFGDYIVGITVLPPQKNPIPDPSNPNQQENKNAKPNPNEVPILVLVDDTTSKKMTKDELHKKFSTIINEIAGKVDKNFKAQSMLLTDLWQNYYDSKYEISKLIAMGAPIHDTGMLAAIKISEIHKTMVLKKFEKYILTYVLAGSLTQGRATEKSDIDVWIVIDDTDVKKMSRLELKEKLRSIIIGMGAEAGQMTGITNKLNIQVYILTDFWDSLKEANPIIFTLLRDGIPMYDRGIFMPWKQLLRLGKIKPSREAIDIFMQSGEQMQKRIQFKLREIGMEDLYYAALTPSQAAIMLYGLPPPTPRETPEVLEEVFVKKEKMLEAKWVKILKRNVQVRKDLEHGDKKAISGIEIDKIIKETEEFLARIKKLFTQIEERKEQKSLIHLHDEVVTIIRDILSLEGVKRAKESEIVKIFENELITSGKVPNKFLRDLNEVIVAKKKSESGKLTKTDLHKAKKGSMGLIRFLVDYLQMKRGRELQRAKIRVKHGSKFAEITLIDAEAFIIRDIDARDGKIEKAAMSKDGSFGVAKKSNMEEFEKALASAKFPQRVFIKEPVFEAIKKHFGPEAEVLLHY
ncbi:nucleotidyltransferase domain-containing protein [archaeon]|jgi:uncharacterized protein (UPF0332 family)/predicted nucleotidyltransferase|nr:nucleotidyltransferase domain-containing protein [archaeon]MBT6762846.1 nucleotidyltransferase domain-containing protein [archaeon]